MPKVELENPGTGTKPPVYGPLAGDPELELEEDDPDPELELDEDEAEPELELDEDDPDPVPELDDDPPGAVRASSFPSPEIRLVFC